MSDMLKLFSENDTPYGKSLIEWSNRWWSWLCGQPTSTNPASNDDDGKHANNCQTFPQVHFLCGTTESGAVVRDCTVPIGKSILMPVVCFEHSHLEIENASSRNLFNLSSDSLDSYDINNMTVDLNKQDLKPNILRIRSPSFTMTFPRENIWNTKNEGSTSAGADGYWIFINQIDKGAYVLNTKASPKEEDGLKIDTTYNLSVV